jgi:hypothetical protein
LILFFPKGGKHEGTYADLVFLWLPALDSGLLDHGWAKHVMSRNNIATNNQQPNNQFLRSKRMEMFMMTEIASFVVFNTRICLFHLVRGKLRRKIAENW